jgi:serine/threonine protein kinase
VTTGNVFYGIKKGQMEELSILKRLSDPRYHHPGKIHCTQLFEDFMCEGEKDHGPHICLEILGPDLATFCRRYPSEILPLPLVKRTVQQILLALDFLHRDCRVAHTGKSSGSFMHSGANLIVRRYQAGQYYDILSFHRFVYRRNYQ